MNRLAELVATLFGTGYLPKAPGTWGAMVATIFAPILFLPLPLVARVLALSSLYIIGAWAASRVENQCGEKDPGCVVIDELVGQWLTLLPFAALSWLELLVGFLVFRFFDILKPPPVKNAETWLPKGHGVMIDDVVAGAYAAVCLFIFRAFLT